MTRSDDHPGELVAAIRARPNDAPLPTEWLLDDAADAIVALQAENAALKAALEVARQYVADAGDDEDPETQRLSSDLLVEIDAALSSGHDNSASGDRT